MLCGLRGAAKAVFCGAPYRGRVSALRGAVPIGRGGQPVPRRAQAALHKTGRAFGRKYRGCARVGERPDGICELPRGKRAARGCARRIPYEHPGPVCGPAARADGAFRRRGRAEDAGFAACGIPLCAGKAVHGPVPGAVCRNAGHGAGHPVRRGGGGSEAYRGQGRGKGQRPHDGAVPHRPRPRHSAGGMRGALQRGAGRPGGRRGLPRLCIGAARRMHHCPK